MAVFSYALKNFGSRTTYVRPQILGSSGPMAMAISTRRSTSFRRFSQVNELMGVLDD